MDNSRKSKAPNAFTLLELLIVMGILGLLFAILLPGVGAVRRSASRNQARQQMAGIQNAMLGFFTEYGRYPLQGLISWPGPGIPAQEMYDSGWSYGRRDLLHEPSENYKRLILSLRGMDEEDNPRGTIFLNVTDRSIDVTTEQYLDPWLNRYAVVADWGMDGNVWTGQTSANQHGLIENTRVALWSWGPGGYDDRSNRDKHIKTWED